VLALAARILRWLIALALALVTLWATAILVYAVTPAVSTLMLARWATFKPVDRDWVPLGRISPHLVAAVVSSEDARYCAHGGVDWTELRSVIDDVMAGGGASRGASTITMQTVKNTLLAPWRVSARKAVEIPLALLVDKVWGKRRTIEIYLNVAEWGEGVFGAQAAARRWFGKDASALSAREAALLAAVLPNPIARRADRPSRAVAVKARRVQARARAGDAGLGCLRG
jgi:monofunctional biosynthetic peptidoglycan transglycosylase